MENATIRFEARKHGVPLRLVAEELGISQPTLYRNLNKQMTKAERDRYLTAIRNLSERAAQGETVTGR